GYSVAIERDIAETWAQDPIRDGSTGSQDLMDEGRRSAALRCMLHSGQTEIVAAHRATTVSWAVPTSLALGVDLRHTLSLDDQGARAIGKCRRIIDGFNLASGEAVTTLSIAIMRGGGSSDPLA